LIDRPGLPPCLPTTTADMVHRWFSFECPRRKHRRRKVKPLSMPQHAQRKPAGGCAPEIPGPGPKKFPNTRLKYSCSAGGHGGRYRRTSADSDCSTKGDYGSPSSGSTFAVIRPSAVCYARCFERGVRSCHTADNAAARPYRHGVRTRGPAARFTTPSRPIVRSNRSWTPLGNRFSGKLALNGTAKGRWRSEGGRVATSRDPAVLRFVSRA